MSFVVSIIYLDSFTRIAISDNDLFENFGENGKRATACQLCGFQAGVFPNLFIAKIFLQLINFTLTVFFRLVQVKQVVQVSTNLKMNVFSKYANVSFCFEWSNTVMLGSGDNNAKKSM